MGDNSEIESMLVQEIRDPSDNTSLYRRYGFPALGVVGLVAVAGLAGHPWRSSTAVGFRGAMGSPGKIIGLADEDAPQDEDAPVEAPGGVAWTVAWTDDAGGEEAVEGMEKVLADAEVPDDKVENIEAGMKCVGEGEACRTLCLAEGEKCRAFWLAPDYDWTTYAADNKKCQDDEDECGTKCNSEEEECAKGTAVDDEDDGDGEGQQEEGGSPEPAEKTVAEKEIEAMKEAVEGAAGGDDNEEETVEETKAVKEIEAMKEAVEGADGVDDKEVETVEETVKCSEVGEACRQICLGTGKACREFWMVDDYDWNNWSADSQKCKDDEESCGTKCNDDEETCLNGVPQERL